MTKQTPQTPADTISLSEKFRLTLIPNSTDIPVAHVASITTIEELDEDRTEVINTYPVQAAFTVDQLKDGAWVQLQEADFTESMYKELKPLVEAEHKRGCELNGTAFDQRMIPEYVHVPIIGHRKHAATLFASLSDKAKIFTDTPLEQSEYQAKPAE